MPIQHENRNGSDRRMFDMAASLPFEKERRWNKDRRRSADDEDDFFATDWDEPDSDLESYVRPTVDD
jgi:hypothetical protein